MPAWMRDFSVAETVGMGLRLPLTPDMQENGLDLLLVYGVDESGDAARGAQTVSELLDAHYYTDGLWYVPPGTPTNNTESLSSGLDRNAPGYVNSYSAVGGEWLRPDPQSAAGVLAAALGIPVMKDTDPSAPSVEWEPHIAAAAQALFEAGSGDASQNWLRAQSIVLGRLATAVGLAPGATLTEASTAEAMNSALWAAGFGYFLSQMLAGTDGPDFQRLDHSNIIAVDAYLRYLDRQRLWVAAQLEVIAQETGITGVDPGTEALAAAWKATIEHRENATGVTPTEAEQQLTGEVTEHATADWQQIHPGETFDSTGDWAGATTDLIKDRTSRYAYFRWLARSQQGAAQSDARLEDWLAGETVPLPSDATFRAIIKDDAYYRYEDRQRLWTEAQLEVIAQETGSTGVDPGSEALAAAWKAAIEHRANATGVTPTEAEQQLTGEVTEHATAEWQRIHAGETFDSAGDWAGATMDLIKDRTSTYAYFRWQARSQQGAAQPDERLEDWLAGETAALYGDATFRAARAHFVSYVRPGGALPAIAVGNQPYGVLVICAVDNWQPSPGEERFRAFVEALRALRDTIWEPCTQKVPQLGPDPISDVGTAQSTLLQLLAMSPLSQQIFAREHVGPDYVRNLWRFVQMRLSPDWSTTTAASSAKVLDDTGVAWTPRLSGLVGAETSSLLTAPVIDDGNHWYHDEWLRWLAGLEGLTYDGESYDRTVFVYDVMSDLPGKAENTPLLYRLLRHALLREYVTAATRILLRSSALGDWEHLEQELIGISPGRDVATWRELLARETVTPSGSTAVIAKYLDAPDSKDDPAASDLWDFRDAVGALSVVSADDLERNLRESIDATSHRLDAWITSLADRRLAVLRQKTPDGTLVGGYGWVENLRPRSNGLNSDGFIHAPSLPQAITASVLRSGYQSYTGGATNPFAVDLSSQRTRMASRLLDAVRSGQPVGRLTGYDFERRLQESGAGQYTRPFRECAPSNSTTFPAEEAAGTSTQTPTSTQQPPSLTDGLVLRDKLGAGDAQVTALLGQISKDDKQRARNGEPALRPVVDAALAGLDDALDATADALIAESLHHAINGVPSRAAATLDALARGDGSVPELDLVASPRTGLTIGHRVVFTVPAGATASTIATVTAIDTAGYTLPAGTQLTLTVKGAPVGFLTDTDLTIPAGSTGGTVTIVAVHNGTSFNGASTPVQLVQQLEWVSSVGITAAASGGIDEPLSSWNPPTKNQLRAAANPTLEVLTQSWLPDPSKVRCTATIADTDGQAQLETVGPAQQLRPQRTGLRLRNPGGAGRRWSSCRARSDPPRGAGVRAPRSSAYPPPRRSADMERTGDFAADELTFVDLTAVCRLARQLLQGVACAAPGGPRRRSAPQTYRSLTRRSPRRANDAEEAVRSAAGWVSSKTPYWRSGPPPTSASSAPRMRPASRSRPATRRGDRRRLADAGQRNSTRWPPRPPRPRRPAAPGGVRRGLPSAPRLPPGQRERLAARRARRKRRRGPTRPRSGLARPHRAGPPPPGGPRPAQHGGAAPSERELTPSSPPSNCPGVAGEAWVGGGSSTAQPTGPASRSLLAGGPLARPAAPLAGLVVDDWTETIADTGPVTGLAYHYQSPLSEPPQAVLLAVPADLSVASWTPRSARADTHRDARAGQAASRRPGRARKPASCSPPSTSPTTWRPRERSPPT